MYIYRILSQLNAVWITPLIDNTSFPSSSIWPLIFVKINVRDFEENFNYISLIARKFGFVLEVIKYFNSTDYKELYLSPEKLEGFLTMQYIVTLIKVLSGVPGIISLRPSFSVWFNSYGYAGGKISTFLNTYHRTTKLLTEQWYLKNDIDLYPGETRVLAGWKFLYTGSNIYHSILPVTVAVVDSGVDGTNPELSGKLIDGCGVFEVDRSNCINSYDHEFWTLAVTCGCPDPNYSEEPSNTNIDWPPYDNFHGTAVAGIIGAKGPTEDGGKGLAGILWDNVKIIPIKLHNIQSIDTIIDTFAWAVSKGAKVINNSWGLLGDGGIPEQLWFDRKGDLAQIGTKALIVWAAGNEGGSYSPDNYNTDCLNGGDDSVAIPQKYWYDVTGNVVVAAARPDGRIYLYSSSGIQIDIAAPTGWGISGCEDNNYNYTWWGQVKNPGFLALDVFHNVWSRSGDTGMTIWDEKFDGCIKKVNTSLRGVDCSYFLDGEKVTIDCYQLSKKAESLLIQDGMSIDAFIANFSGTSGAAPMVSGIAAGLFSLVKGLTPAEAEKLLKKTARKVPGVYFNGDPSSCWGSGIVDAYNAWSSAFTSSVVPAPPNIEVSATRNRIVIGCTYGRKFVTKHLTLTFHNEITSSDAERPGYIVVRPINGFDLLQKGWNISILNENIMVLTAGSKREFTLQIGHYSNWKSTDVLNIGIWTNEHGNLPPDDPVVFPFLLDPPDRAFRVELYSLSWHFHYFPIICGIPCYIAGPVFCPWCWECKDPPMTNDPCDLCEDDINNENYDTENCHACVNEMLNLSEYRNQLQENENCSVCVNIYLESGWEDAMHSDECQNCITAIKQQYYNGTVTGG